jgi:hypothetical protein
MGGALEARDADEKVNYSYIIVHEHKFVNRHWGLDMNWRKYNMKTRKSK